MADVDPGQVAGELEDGTFVPAARSDEIDALSDDALEQAIQEKAAQEERDRQQKASDRIMSHQPKAETVADGDDSEQATGEARELVGATAPEQEESGEQKQGDDRLREIQEELELQRLRAERLDAEIKRSTYQRDHFAGEIGHLKSLLSKTKSQPEQESEFSERQEQPIQDEDRRELRDELSSLRRERVQSVIQAAAAHFEANVIPAQIERFEKIWGKDTGKDLRAAMDKIVASRAPEFADDLSGTNPKRAQLAVETIVKSALADAQIEMIETRREMVQRERAAQAEKLKARKQDADMAGRGRVAPKTPSRAKTADDLSDDELEAAVQRAVVHEVASRSR